MSQILIKINSPDQLPSESPSKRDIPQVVVESNVENVKRVSIQDPVVIDSESPENPEYEYEQVFMRNPCFCECPLHETVDWIGAFEFMWGISNAVLCIFTLAVSQFFQQYSLDSSVFLTPEQRTIIQTALACHCIECILAWLLIVGTSHRIRCLCIFWMGAIALTMVIQIVIISIKQYVATGMGVITHPLKIYFIYVVWAFVQELKTFPRGPPIPIVRQVLAHSSQVGGDTKVQKKKNPHISVPIPLLLPTSGYYSYYPSYYAALDYGFYSSQHPYHLNNNNLSGDKVAAIIAERNNNRTGEQDNFWSSVPHR